MRLGLHTRIRIEEAWRQRPGISRRSPSSGGNWIKVVFRVDPDRPMALSNGHS